jgi:hypothetical protein
MKTAQSSGKRPVHQAAPEGLNSVLKGAFSCWQLAMLFKASGSTAETPRKFSPEPSVRKLFNRGLTRRKAAWRSLNRKWSAAVSERPAAARPMTG